MQTKEPQPAWKKKGVVWCTRYLVLNVTVYTSEKLEETEEKTEHRGAVRRNDTKNGIAVHARKTQHKVDWDASTVKQIETNYTRRSTIKVIHIKKQGVTSNLNCGRHLNPVWHPLIHNYPQQLIHHLFQFNFNYIPASIYYDIMHHPLSHKIYF